MEDESGSAFVDATGRALCEHGYADLTLADVATEADTSTSAILYHYGSKDELLEAVIEDLPERFECIEDRDGSSPADRFDGLLQVLCSPEDDPERRQLRIAAFELAAQAPYNPALRKRLADLDDVLVERFRRILAAGVDAGVFDPGVQPARDAECLAATVTGLQVRSIASDSSAEELYEAVRRHVERELLAEDRQDVTP